MTLEPEDDLLPTSDPITDDEVVGEPPAAPEEPDEDDPAIGHEPTVAP